MTHHPGKYVTTDDVARRWSVSAKTVRALIAAGSLKAIKIGVKTYQVLADSVEEYERRAEVRP